MSGSKEVLSFYTQPCALRDLLIVKTAHQWWADRLWRRQSAVQGKKKKFFSGIGVMKIAVLLSGGVDSSVALNLLKQAGHEVEAFYIKIWLEDELAFLGNCPWEEDLKFARAVCEAVGVPLTVISLQAEYFERIVSYAIAELKAGRTPSPDVLCNQHIKFGEFVTKIDGSFAKVASGHYARVEESSGRFLLKRSPDPVKDQTYFLSYLNQEQLSRALFPLGEMRKSEVRAFAREHHLPNQDRKDSQGVCFLGKIRYRDFIRFHLGEKEGEIVDSQSGQRLGAHPGHWFFTIGQRQGMGLSGGPWYVVRKDIEHNRIFVCDNAALSGYCGRQFGVANVNWIGDAPRKEDVQVKIRHGERLFQCHLALNGPGFASVAMDVGDAGIAAGQFAVFYDGDVCLGGGVIEPSVTLPKG